MIQIEKPTLYQFDIKHSTTQHYISKRLKCNSVSFPGAEVMVTIEMNL